MSEELLARLNAQGNYIAQAIEGSTAIVAVYGNISPPPVDQEKLAAARQKLAELPLETLPARTASSGSSWRMPFAENRRFVGREDELCKLAEILKERERAVAIVTALGGTGKTQLVSEFVHRYGHYFAGVFWLSFADADAVSAEIADCRTALGSELRLDIGTLKQDEQVQVIRATWQNGLPRLLIFDTCEEESLFAQWRPPAGDCRILVTSRRARWDVELGVQTLPLDVLSRDESLALLHNHLSRFSPAEKDAVTDDLKAIADELGHLPLALHLAGSFLNMYGKRSDPPRVYLAHLRNMPPLQHTSLRDEGVTSSTKHIKHIERTFALSFERLNRTNPRDGQALRLLARAAYFASGIPIARGFLSFAMVNINEALDTTHQIRDALEQLQDLERQITDALERLIELGLIDEIEGEDALRLHRLLAMFVQGQTALEDLDAQADVERMLILHANILNASGNPAQLLTLQPHLYAAIGLAKQREDRRVAALYNGLGTHLRMTGAYHQAEFYLQRALAIRERVLGPDDFGTAQSLASLAAQYAEQEKYEEAEVLFRRSLDIVERVLGPADADTANAMSNLASLYLQQEKYQEAEPLLKQAHAIYVQLLEPQHFLIAHSFSSLAALSEYQGKYEEAEVLYQQALALYERELEEGEHPYYMAIAISNLGKLYYRQGKYREAEPLFERALAIRERTLKPDHLDTAENLSDLGKLYTNQGRHVEAESLSQRALSIYQQVLGLQHPRTAAKQLVLAEIYSSQGEDEKAEPLYEQALVIYEQLLGPDHPDMIIILGNLANIYSNQGKFEKAQQLYDQALRISKQAPEHESLLTINSLHNLAWLYESQEKFGEAEGLFQMSLYLCRRDLGFEHSVTAGILNNLAVFYAKQGRHEEAKQSFQDALAIYEGILGPDHPETARTRNSLARLYNTQGKYAKEALPRPRINRQPKGNRKNKRKRRRR